jgi:trans-aconitate 2-methyltransferase
VTSSPAKSIWNAADYAAHSAVQQAWARELIAQLHLRGDERVLDVGCGDGKVTAEIARAVPCGAGVGIDASAQMIAFARKTFPPGKNPNLAFQVCDARRISPAALFAGGTVASDLFPGALASRRRVVSVPAGSAFAGLRPDRRRRSQGHGEGVEAAPFDIVFSNAALHWVDDHQAFLRGAASVLKPGGRLMVSCGGRGNAQDVFLALRPEMRLKRWRGFFRKLEKPYFFHSPADYEKWLPRFGFKTNGVELSPRDAVYNGRDRFAAWLRTTWLPYTQRVPREWREEFIAAVADRYLARHPPDTAGRVRVRMVRLEIDAVKT